MNKKAKERALELARKTRFQYSETGAHLHAGKKAISELWKAREQKKKLPTLSAKPHQKNPEFAKMSIEEYEKKYG